MPATHTVRDPRSDDAGGHLAGELERRERLADLYGYDFGRERVFPELVAALMQEVPEGSSVLEVGAATGLLTRPLLACAGSVTALEPSQGLLRRLLESDAADSDRLTVVQGIVEDLPNRIMHDVAVVTFTPRQGVALVRLLDELASRVSRRVVVLMDEASSLDWAYLARAAAMQGFEVHLRIVSGAGRRAVVLTADVSTWTPTFEPVVWGEDSRDIEAGYPIPRGEPARIVREFLAAGDRVLRVRIAPEGVTRLYGSMRTAAHREGGDLAVHRQDDGVMLVRMPPESAPRKRSSARDGE